jgi:hypothetical protein
VSALLRARGFAHYLEFVRELRVNAIDGKVILSFRLAVAS